MPFNNVKKGCPTTMMPSANYAAPLPNSVSCTGPSASIPLSPSLPSEAGYVDTGHANSTGPPLCAGCSQPILDQFILQVQGHMWHSNCLCCSMCHAPLSHVCYSGHSDLYCQDDFFRLFGAQCSSCKGTIPPTDIVRRAQNNVYHLDCFRCRVCRQELCTGDEFYLCEDGKLLCKADYCDAKNKEQSGDPMNKTSEHSEEKENLLQHYYAENSRPRSDVVEQIAVEAGVEPSSVRSWFRQQRALNRRKSSNYERADDNRNEMIGRVLAPPGGYPLPIVNNALPAEPLPEGASPHLSCRAENIVHGTGNQSHMTQFEDFWSNDFVPPNVDLEPENLSNGEVIGFRYHNSVPTISTDELDKILYL